MFYFSEISRTTNSFGYFVVTVDKTNNGHSKSLFGYLIIEIEIGREKTNLGVTLDVDDNLSVDESSW